LKKNRLNLSIIDKDVKIDGNISSKGKLIIKGNVKGTIDGEIVIIAQEGYLNSKSKVTNMTIGGVFEGELFASQNLIILSTGKCSGKVTCKDLIVENGGILNAEVTCKTSSEKTSEKTSKNSNKIPNFDLQTAETQQATKK